MKTTLLAAVGALALAGSALAQPIPTAKRDARDLGHHVAQTGRATGHAVANTGREVGHATLQTGRDARHGFRHRRHHRHH